MALSKPADVTTAKAVAELDQRLRQLESFLPFKGQLVEFDLSDNFARVRHRLGRPYRGFVSIGGVELVDDKKVKHPEREIWLRRSAAWTLLEYKEVDADTDSITFDDLDGDVDVQYRLECYLVNSVGGTQSYKLEPNGVTTDQDGQQFTAIGAAATAANVTNLTIFEGGATGVSISVQFLAKTGGFRQMVATAATSTSTPVAAFHAYAGTWRESTTRVTSLDITQANTSIGAGSRFWLYALGNRPTKAKAWVF